MDSRYLVYGLFDPRTGELRYVGKTKQRLSERLGRHKRDALEKHEEQWFDRTHRACWLRELYSNGLGPEVEVFEQHQTIDEVNDAERFLIEYWRALGANLTNTTQGGDGGIVSRRPACSDEQVMDLYRAGLKTGIIARRMGTCKKRVTRLLTERGLIRPGQGARKTIVDDRGNRFASINEAAQFYGVCLGAVSNVLRGRAKTSAGRKFSYTE